MSIDPNSIPQHVVDAAWNAFDAYGLGAAPATDEDAAILIAAALAALMDHEPVEVSRRVGRCGLSWQLVAWVYPDNVLAAVLERARGKS
jgi:hypothetical protein